MATPTFYSPQQLERLASHVLHDYQRQTGKPLAPPISAEDLVDFAFQGRLRPVLWEPMPEKPGHTVLGGLAPAARRIVVNERRRALFENCPGLANDTVGHEIGHWVLHVDHARLGQPTLPGVAYHLEFACERDNHRSWDEKNAHRFMGALLMPADLLLPRVLSTGTATWRSRYALSGQFDVTITAMNVRLEELGFGYLEGTGEGTLRPSRQEAAGQRRML